MSATAWVSPEGELVYELPDGAEGYVPAHEALAGGRWIDPAAPIEERLDALTLICADAEAQAQAAQQAAEDLLRQVKRRQRLALARRDWALREHGAEIAAAVLDRVAAGKRKSVDAVAGRYVVRESRRARVLDPAAAIAEARRRRLDEAVKVVESVLTSALPADEPWPGVVRETVRRVAIEGGATLVEEVVAVLAPPEVPAHEPAAPEPDEGDLFAGLEPVQAPAPVAPAPAMPEDMQRDFAEAVERAAEAAPAAEPEPALVEPSPAAVAAVGDAASRVEAPAPCRRHSYDADGACARCGATRQRAPRKAPARSSEVRPEVEAIPPRALLRCGRCELNMSMTQDEARAEVERGALASCGRDCELFCVDAATEQWLAGPPDSDDVEAMQPDDEGPGDEGETVAPRLLDRLRGDDEPDGGVW